MFKKSTSRMGASLIEFSIVLPVLFMIFAALFELGRMMLLQNTADTAAYEGARHAMVPGATADEAIAEARLLLEQARVVDAEVTVNPSEINETTGAISVHISIPFAKNCWFFRTVGAGFNVSSDVTLLAERVPLIQLTGLPELKKQAKGSGGKVDL